jgi:hypothetical protein
LTNGWISSCLKSCERSQLPHECAGHEWAGPWIVAGVASLGSAGVTAVAAGLQVHAHQPQKVAILLDQDLGAPAGRPAVGMPHAELWDVPLAHRIEDAAAHREAGVDPVAFPTGDQIIGIAAGEERIPLVGGKDQLRRPRTIDLLQGDDVGAEPVAVPLEELVVCLGPGGRARTERLADNMVEVVQVSGGEFDRHRRRAGACQQCGSECAGCAHYVSHGSPTQYRVVPHGSRLYRIDGPRSMKQITGASGCSSARKLRGACPIVAPQAVTIR